MTKEMQNYLEGFKDRNYKNVLNEWYVKNLPIDEQIDSMDNHKEMKELFDLHYDEITEMLDTYHKFYNDDNDGFNNWVTLSRNIKPEYIFGNEAFTNYCLCAFFPLEVLKDPEILWSWLEDYHKIVKEYVDKATELRRKYNGD